MQKTSRRRVFFLLWLEVQEYFRYYCMPQSEEHKHVAMHHNSSALQLLFKSDRMLACVSNAWNYRQFQYNIQEFILELEIHFFA